MIDVCASWRVAAQTMAKDVAATEPLLHVPERGGRDVGARTVQLAAWLATHSRSDSRRATDTRELEARLVGDRPCACRTACPSVSLRVLLIARARSCVCVCVCVLATSYCVACECDAPLWVRSSLTPLACAVTP